MDLQQAAQTLVPDGRSNQPMTLGSLIAQQRQASASGQANVTDTNQTSEGATETTGTVAMSDGECLQLQQQMQQVGRLSN